jgi:hypothetical protein
MIVEQSNFEQLTPTQRKVYGRENREINTTKVWTEIEKKIVKREIERWRNR